MIFQNKFAYNLITLVAEAKHDHTLTGPCFILALLYDIENVCCATVNHSFINLLSNRILALLTFFKGKY